MNYPAIYRALMNRAQNRNTTGYVEKHRILPGCMGGKYTDNNVVLLTPEEHYVAHQLLVKIYPGNHKLAKAVMMMTAGRSGNKIYGWVRRRHALAQSQCQTGSGNSQHGTMWVHNIDLRLCKKVPAGTVPRGWSAGRVIDFDKHCYSDRIKADRKKKKQENRQKNIDKYREYYRIYNIVGWQEFVHQTGYSKTKQNFVSRCSELLEEFIPQNGKRRGQ